MHAIALRAGVALALIAGGTGAAAARPLETELPVGGAVCYERAYTPGHLATHLKQQVTHIKLDVSSQDSQEGKETIAALVEVTLTGKSEPYDLSGFCTPDAKGLRCKPEWDAGTFRIDPAKEGGLLVTNQGMVFNPSGYDAEERAPGAIRLTGDDKAWQIPVAGECKSAPARKGGAER